jgi:hypothetical protein
MPFSSGVFSRVYNWVTDKNNSINITASRMDTEMNGMATGLSTCLLKDGTQTVTANIPMANHKFTGLLAGSAGTDSANVGQLQGNLTQYCGTAGGTANAITLTPSPAITSLVAGQRFQGIIATTNTGAATLAISGLTATAIKKSIGGALVALVANDLIAAVIYDFYYDGTQYVLLSPVAHSHGADIASATTIVLDTATGDLVDVTGTTAITTITLAEGREATVRFTGILTLTNGASLVLPGGANITTAAGDYAIFRGYASGVVRCVNYAKIDGTAPISALIGVQTFTSTGAGTYTPTAGMKKCIIEMQAGGGGSGGTTGAGGQTATSGSGAGGGYFKLLATAANIGASAALSVGIAGTAGTSGNNSGTAGGDTTITINSSTWTAKGGAAGGGKASSASAQFSGTPGMTAANTTGSNATIIANIPGQSGSYGQSNGATTTSSLWAGQGGDSVLGRGGSQNISSEAGGNYGGGASGVCNTSGSNAAGVAGAQGIIIIHEYA